MKNNYSIYIESSKDFPKKGITFRDFTPILMNPKIFREAILDIMEHFKDKGITKIAAIESKGFIIGSALAYEMHCPMQLIRKPNLTPGKTISNKFEKEYGVGEYQIKTDAFCKEDNVLVVYDILAGSGATSAAIALLKKTGAQIAGCSYIIELAYLKGREQLSQYDIFSLVKISEKEQK